ncbi:MAG TPA: Fur family transcriptional regulator [Leptospiraceae bacterium]|nr:Fur family transcriptional regulator [Leptospiraceae bacterium]HMY65639.1 Fur family transcriptional regulator [Leptospiraceae bacterium]HMZ57814.1 Fur family transcriptional regulator [Leptospiraceae bacterium]HNF28222.1 Fur family transcriptional regulator [Leptospiraceae bacterium]HNH07677.1 Fur family transcriptional regulator [Leptospiraceae bacterium]
MVSEKSLESLKKNKLKVTRNRIAVLDLLKSSDKPMTHSDIMEGLSKEGHWDRVTIYRTLSEFAEKQIVQIIHSDERLTYFELKDDPPEHGHLICDSCGKLYCLKDEMFHLRLEGNLKSFQIKRIEIFIRGLCKSCQ